MRRACLPPRTLPSVLMHLCCSFLVIHAAATTPSQHSACGQPQENSNWTSQSNWTELLRILHLKFLAKLKPVSQRRMSESRPRGPDLVGDETPRALKLYQGFPSLRTSDPATEPSSGLVSTDGLPGPGWGYSGATECSEAFLLPPTRHTGPRKVGCRGQKHTSSIQLQNLISHPSSTLFCQPSRGLGAWGTMLSSSRARRPGFETGQGPCSLSHSCNTRCAG